jgi:anti-sigma regulatory factor (Ser/Thr protein kinase)
LIDPGKVLEHANEQLVPDIPAQMFVTCLYGILDPSTGSFVYANAGHNLPYASDGNEVREMRATGMPLGLLPGMPYDEQESVVQPGEVILLHSDGIAEAHNEQREMFGFPRLLGLTKKHPKGEELIDEVLSELDRFTGGGEQEDDITLVALTRSGGSGKAHFSFSSEVAGSASESQGTEVANGQKVLAEFDLPSVDGNERIAMSKVAEAVDSLGLEEGRLDRLKTAVAEATMNAIEHGNGHDAEIPVLVKVSAWPDRVAVRITDQGGGTEVPEPETPDIQAKLDGLQKPRGWGLFLIKNMVDEMNVSHDDKHHTIELVMSLRGDES